MKASNIIEKEIKPSVATTLKALEVSMKECAEFDIARIQTVRNSIQRLNDSGRRFTTRTENNKVYVWRIA